MQKAMVNWPDWAEIGLLGWGDPNFVTGFRKIYPDSVTKRGKGRQTSLRL